MDSSNSSESSATYSTVADIINFVVNLYENDDYSVINSYNNTEQIDLNGVISIGVANYQHLNNGTSNDYRITINIGGQFLTAQDISQSKTYTMFDFIISRLDVNTIINGLSDCAGAVKNGGGVKSDGQINTCNYSIDLYMCKD